MNSVILSSLPLLFLFGGGAVLIGCSALWPGKRSVFSLLSAACSTVGMLYALLLGATLQELLVVFLILTMISFLTAQEPQGDR